MKAKDLKNTLLQLAVQGKLVPQDPTGEPASELLERIRAEKSRLIKEGKIKKEKPLPPITEDEIPFEIPENWVWVRLGEICEYIQRGRSPKYSLTKKYPVIAQKCNQWSGFSIEKAQFIDPDTLCKYSEERILQDSDLLWNSTGLGTLGRIAVYYTRLNPYSLAVADSHVTVIRNFKQYVLSVYLYYFIASPAVQTIIEEQASGSTKQKELATTTIKNYLIPLPPLSEQARIVSKIEELLPYVEEYGAAEERLSVLNRDFPSALRKSILQEAVQGKLVPQDPADEPASELLKRIQNEKAKLIKEGKIKKEKPLPPITEDEIPFEIPENWVWVRLGWLCEKIGAGSTPKGGGHVYTQTGVKFLREQNIYNEGLILDNVVYIDEKTNELKKNSQVRAKDLLMNITGGSIGRNALVPEDFDIANVNQHVLIVRLIDELLRFYIHYFLCSPLALTLMFTQQSGDKPGLGAIKVKNFLLPLPPLSEQARIVSKIEELFSLCGEIDR